MTIDDSSASPIRRWGPLATVLAGLIGVAALVTLRAPADGTVPADPPGTAPATAPAPVPSVADQAPGCPEWPQCAPAPTGAPGSTPHTTPTTLAAPPADAPLSFSEARAHGIEATFPEACDPVTGRVAIPYYFAPECYAARDLTGLPGDGATARGVTADTITVVVYQAPAVDPVRDYVTAAVRGDDTPEQQQATITGYAELFESNYQTYGRHVELVFLEGSGPSNDEVAARADAVRAVEELGAFAVWGGPSLTNAWSDEIAARDVVCIHCQPLADDHPNVFATMPAPRQNRVILAEYLLTKLAGRPATFAGDPAMHTNERVFGHLFIEASDHGAQVAGELGDALAQAGSGFAVQLGYELDPPRLHEQATTVIARMKDAGVTSVVVQADPVALATFTREATAQRYFPEWVIGPSTLVDTAAFGRTYDQEQWAHAFGLSPRAAPVDRERFPTLYEWWFGEPAPADDNESALMAMPAIFYGAIQRAGPNLTVDSLRAGLYGTEPIAGSVTAPSFSYGDHGLFPTLAGADHGGVDNWTEIWWDAGDIGPDELGRVGPGRYRYVDGARRYYPGELTDELRVFDPAGTVTMFTEYPALEAERIGEYVPRR